MTLPAGEMGIVGNLLNGFIALQKEAGVHDSGNMIQNKWDMRDVYRHIGNVNETRKLIRFFIMFSDDKSFRAFFRDYADYWQKMQEVRQDRAIRNKIQRDTLEKVIKSKEKT